MSARHRPSARPTPPSTRPPVDAVEAADSEGLDGLIAESTEKAEQARAYPVRQALTGGPRDGQAVAVADHVQEIRYGAGGVYRRSADGNFEWVSPA